MISIVMMLVERAELVAYVVRMISGWLAQQVEQAVRPIRLTHVPMVALPSRGVGHLGSGQTSFGPPPRDTAAGHLRQSPVSVCRPQRTQHTTTELR